MNILFLSLIDFETIEEKGIYTDLLREFAHNNHNLYIVSPVERRKGKDTYITQKDNVSILKPLIGNTQKTNIFEKGISTITLEGKVLRAIKKYYSDIKFDLILYATPPITFEKIIKYIKRRDNAKTYLMLKDIFPQNSVDIEMLTKTGLKGIVYKFFRNKEKKLYDISDYIGCMSQANIDYVLKKNTSINKDKVGMCPNCIEVLDTYISDDEKISLRKKYGLPVDKKVFVYGGNLGKPQGIQFMIECIKEQADNKDIFFFIVGSGTEFDEINKYITESEQNNVFLLKQLPREDYDKLIHCCDIGLIFLDYRFTIPNFPSRLLAYMQAKLPVLAVTDVSTDIGKVIVQGEFGWWCPSNNIEEWNRVIKVITNYDDIDIMKENSFNYLINEFNVNKLYEKIVADIALIDRR